LPRIFSLKLLSNEDHATKISTKIKSVLARIELIANQSDPKNRIRTKQTKSLKRLIEYSPEIEEIDIHNNTIGNMSATLLVNALEMRRLKKVGSLAVRVSEKIEPELFATILKLSKKVKKKKGGRRKVGIKKRLLFFIFSVFC
jgi:hypothetical protein